MIKSKYKLLGNIKEDNIFLMLFIFLGFQNITVLTIAGISIKISHLFSLLLLFPLINKKKISINISVTMFVIYIILISCINSIDFGINSLIINYIFGLYLIILINSLGKEISYKMWINLCCKGSWIILITILINDISQVDKFVYFFKNTWMGHPVINTIFLGSVNLEATWISMFNIFFLNKKSKWIYFSFAIFISLLYACRVAIIINLLCFLWFILPFIKINYESILKSLVLILFTVVITIYIYRKGFFDIIIDRFANIGNEPGSLGRLNMWQYAFKTIINYPFGCGIGNNMKALTKVSGIKFPDPNMHNIYLQNFVDLGWIGGFYYIFALIYFFVTNRKDIFNNSFLAFLLIYCLISLFQFRGGDSITFFILGIYLNLKKSTIKMQT